VITEYKTVTVVQEKFIPVPAALTAPVAGVERPPVVDTIALGATLKACIIRLDVANRQLAEIASLGEPE
jgi:hypothetical protein